MESYIHIAPESAGLVIKGLNPGYSKTLLAGQYAEYVAHEDVASAMRWAEALIDSSAKRKRPLKCCRYGW